MMMRFLRRRNESSTTPSGAQPFPVSDAIRTEAATLFARYDLDQARSFSDLLNRLSEIRGLPLTVRAVSDPAVKKKTAIGISNSEKIEFLLFRPQNIIACYWDLAHEIGHAVAGHPCSAKDILLEPGLRKYIPKGATAWGRPPGVGVSIESADEVDDALWNEGVAEQIAFDLIRSLLVPAFVSSERRYG